MKKIAFWDTVADAYGFLLANLGGFFKLCGAWIVAIAAVTTAAAVLLAPVANEAAIAVATIAALALSLAGVTAFAVAWHRTILKAEAPAIVPRFKRREWRFLGYSVLVSLILFAAAMGAGLAAGIVAGAVAAAAGKAGAVVGAAAFVLVIVAGAYGARLALALPAVAVDEPGNPLGPAWERGKGNGTRLLFGTLVCLVPIVIVQAVLQWLLGTPAWQREIEAHASALPASATGGIVLGVLYVALSFAQVAVTVGFLSFSYRQIMDRA
jgi:hypothetical protein